MDLTRKIIVLFVLLVCILITSVVYFLSIHPEDNHQGLDKDFYDESCPIVHDVIRSTFQELFKQKPGIPPAFIRLVFHDCFLHGCDASILLDSTDKTKSERDTPPNLSVRGLKEIDIINSRLEKACPGVVSCADIVVLAARESVLAVGGPFYPLKTGGRDNSISFTDEAFRLPNPDFDHYTTILSSALKGFNQRELVLTTEQQSITHCGFIRKRLDNFTTTGGPDSGPSIDPEFLETLKANLQWQP